MRAFEIWRKENAASGRSCKADARVWKAALEWLSNSCWCGGDVNSSGEWEDCEFITEIQKELADD